MSQFVNIEKNSSLKGFALDPKKEYSSIKSQQQYKEY